MSAERAVGLVIHTYDWSESSRVAVIFTREFGKVRVLAKGGRRIKSNFEVALDLLNVCSMVLLRKNSEGLELLTEARIEERFAGLKTNLRALYAAYYVAELLDLGTQDHDPHPGLFDAALQTLRSFNSNEVELSLDTMRFELAWLREIGYAPELANCSRCGSGGNTAGWYFSSSSGGLVCDPCRSGVRDSRKISDESLSWLRNAGSSELPGQQHRNELRQLLSHYVSHHLGKRPKLLNYIL